MSYIQDIMHQMDGHGGVRIFLYFLFLSRLWILITKLLFLAANVTRWFAELLDLCWQLFIIWEQNLKLRYVSFENQFCIRHTNRSVYETLQRKGESLDDSRDGGHGPLCPEDPRVVPNDAEPRITTVSHVLSCMF